MSKALHKAHQQVISFALVPYRSLNSNVMAALNAFSNSFLRFFVSLSSLASLSLSDLVLVFVSKPKLSLSCRYCGHSGSDCLNLKDGYLAKNLLICDTSNP